MSYNRRMNYITHIVRRKPSFRKWQYEYYKDLQNIYSIFVECLMEKYTKNETNWSSHELFDDFCYMIYNRSSKFIFKDYKM